MDDPWEFGLCITASYTRQKIPGRRTKVHQVHALLNMHLTVRLCTWDQSVGLKTGCRSRWRPKRLHLNFQLRLEPTAIQTWEESGLCRSHLGLEMIQCLFTAQIRTRGGDVSFIILTDCVKKRREEKGVKDVCGFKPVILPVPYWVSGWTFFCPTAPEPYVCSSVQPVKNKLLLHHSHLHPFSRRFRRYFTSILRFHTSHSTDALGTTWV